MADKEKTSESTTSVRSLIVDNDKDHAQAMVESLERIGHDCTIATSGPDGSRLIAQNNYEIIVSDLVMNEIDGMQLLKEAKESLPDCEVILVTGHASVPKAVEAMKEGAFNFLEKPISPKQLQAIADKAVESIRLRQQNRELQGRLDERFGFENLIFASDSMKAVVERLRRIAPTDAGVLITGQTGTGKDVVAQAIHQNSPRKKKPFVAINTAAVAEHLVESELFGHVKGSFTDAISNRIGKFEYADGGTIFLDEVGDMPLPTQIKLLRVLEERKITKVGDNKPIDVNVRVLAATNKDLEKEIEEGRFRSDLYFRLKIVTVHLEPLASRREDILPLADFFRRQTNQRNNVPANSNSFSRELRNWMLNYDWKGNVRQLKNVVESLVVMDIDGILDMDDLSPDLLPESDSSSEIISSNGQTPVGPVNLIGKKLEDIDRWAVEETLKLAGGNRKETASILGISERTLYRKLILYGLRDDK